MLIHLNMLNDGFEVRWTGGEGLVVERLPDGSVAEFEQAGLAACSGGQLPFAFESSGDSGTTTTSALTTTTSTTTTYDELPSP